MLTIANSGDSGGEQMLVAVRGAPCFSGRLAQRSLGRKCDFGSTTPVGEGQLLWRAEHGDRHDYANSKLLPASSFQSRVV